jgi:hypothetical protein
VYILLRAAYWEQATRFWHVLGTLILWILQYIAYQGILSSSETSNTSTDLAGGVFLDLLGLTVVIQFGTALWTPKVYWLLAAVPTVGLWKLYKSFKSIMPGAGIDQSTTQAEETTSDEKTDKRRKRAERRRQKWS